MITIADVSGSLYGIRASGLPGAGSRAIAGPLVVSGLVLIVTGCAAPPRVVEIAPLLACPVVDASLWRAGELADGLPADPADAVLALWRAYLERGEALEAIRRQLEDGR